MKKNLLILLLLFLCGALPAKKIYLRGYVLDNNNRGIDLANIQVKGTSQGTSTNEQGFYELRLEATDTFHVVYSCIGYETKEYKFAATEDVINATKILPSVSTQLESVEIRAFQRQTNTMQGIDTEKFRMMPDASGGNLESMLSSFAGVNSTNELSSKLSA